MVFVASLCLRYTVHRKVLPQAASPLEAA